MHSDTFNPDAPGVNNGNFFGLPFTAEESKIVLMGIPWDVTTSYRCGTSEGPEAILNASLQVDLYDADFGNIWEKGIATAGINKSLKKKSKSLRETSMRVIRLLESGTDMDDPKLFPFVKEVNAASNALNEWVYSACWNLIQEKKIPGLIGGEHSIPYGCLKALCEFHDQFGILQIDAHADLRHAYEGFEFSHASIMYNAMNLKAVTSIVQVGIRDFCETEKKLACENSFIHWFESSRIFSEMYLGKTWDKICDEIVSCLPDKVYVSFDIDGLDLSFCPGTGTPVPGGLDFNQVSYLLKKLSQQKKTIIGFDLCEVAPGPIPDIDAITGARILYKLCGLAINSK
ncbi:MAG: agmatinase family protein [Sphingobacteriales bacterium]|nr:agmatinase family protein [Sphingobacteriales bacterium]